MTILRDWLSAVLGTFEFSLFLYRHYHLQLNFCISNTVISVYLIKDISKFIASFSMHIMCPGWNLCIFYAECTSKWITGIYTITLTTHFWSIDRNPEDMNQLFGVFLGIIYLFLKWKDTHNYPHKNHAQTHMHACFKWSL